MPVVPKQVPHNIVVVKVRLTFFCYKGSRRTRSKVCGTQHPPWIWCHSYRGNRTESHAHEQEVQGHKWAGCKRGTNNGIAVHAIKTHQSIQWEKAQDDKDGIPTNKKKIQGISAGPAEDPKRYESGQRPICSWTTFGIPLTKMTLYFLFTFCFLSV